MLYPTHVFRFLYQVTTLTVERKKTAPTLDLHT